MILARSIERGERRQSHPVGYFKIRSQGQLPCPVIPPRRLSTPEEIANVGGSNASGRRKRISGEQRADSRQRQIFTDQLRSDRIRMIDRPAPCDLHGERLGGGKLDHRAPARNILGRSEEHTSELQSLMRISYAVFCLKKNNPQHKTSYHI